jgi:hypothetical protein
MALPCPLRIPEDVKEHRGKTTSLVALYFVDLNQWFEGELVEVLSAGKLRSINYNKAGKPRKKQCEETMTMRAFDDRKKYNFDGKKELYGSIWVLITC